MKHHKKTYENVYSIDREDSKIKLNLDEISVYAMEPNEYNELFKSFLTDFYSGLFLNCIKLSWLRRKFSYYGRKTILPMQKNSILLNSSFVKLMRRHIGNDIQIITKSKFFAKLEMYFDDLFPEFELWNPFESPEYYEFPYKNISLEYLLVVYQMDDRLEMLKYADDQHMTYAVFLDWVINHAYSENDSLGRTRYEIKQNQARTDTFHVKDTDKKLKAQKGKKRI